MSPSTISVDQKNKRIVLLATLLIFVTLVYLLWRYPLAELIDHVWLSALIKDLGWLGLLAFVLAGSLATSVGLPRQLVSFIGGYSLGVVLGVLLATLAAIGGCFLCFWFSRHFFKGYVSARYAKTVALLNSFVDRDAFLKIIVLRLQPFGTNLITNLSAGVSEIRAPVFIASSLLGYVPQMLVFALLGAGVKVHSKTQVAVSSMLFVLSLLLGWYLYHRHRVSLAPR